MSVGNLPRGRHVLVDLAGYVAPEDDEGEWMLKLIQEAVAASPAREVHSHVETFDGSSSPRGYAAVVLIDESHVTAHCYSEEGLLAIDSFSCGQCEPQMIVDHLLGNLFDTIPTLEICNSEEVSRFNTQSSADAEFAPDGVRQLLERHYRHFNAGVLDDTAVSLSEFLDADGRLLITLAGAMSRFPIR